MNRLPLAPILEWSPNGVRIYDPASKQTVVADTLEQALAQANRPRVVILALSRRKTFVKSIRLPDVPHDEALNILRLQLDELFPVDPHELAYDLEFTNDRNQDGRLAVVVAAKAEILRQAKDELKQNGIKVVRVLPAFVGSAVMAVNSGYENALVLDETPEGTAFDVVQAGHVVYTRLAKTDGTAAGVNAEALRTVAAAGVKEAPLLNHTEFNLPNAVQASESPLGAIAQTHTPYQLELPEDLVNAEKKVVTSRRNLAILALLGVVIYAYSVWDDRDVLSADIKKQQRQWDTDLRSVESEYNRLNARLTDIEQKSVIVSNAFTPVQYASDVATAVSSLAGEGLWLTGVSFERGRPMTIRGTAKTNDQVASYVDTLTAQSRFRDVTLAFSNNAEIESTPVVQFSINAHVVGNFPLAEIKPATANRRPASNGSANNQAANRPASN